MSSVCSFFGPPCIVTMVVPCIISAIKRDIVVENHNFSYLFAFDAPIRGRDWNIAIPFGTEKLKWCGYPTVQLF